MHLLSSITSASGPGCLHIKIVLVFESESLNQNAVHTNEPPHNTDGHKFSRMFHFGHASLESFPPFPSCPRLSTHPPQYFHLISQFILSSPFCFSSPQPSPSDWQSSFLSTTVIMVPASCPSYPLVFIPRPPCLHVLFHFLNIVIFLMFCSLQRFIFSRCQFLHLYFSSSSSSTFSFYRSPPPPPVEPPHQWPNPFSKMKRTMALPTRKLWNDNHMQNLIHASSVWPPIQNTKFNMFRQMRHCHLSEEHEQSKAMRWHTSTVMTLPHGSRTNNVDQAWSANILHKFKPKHGEYLFAATPPRAKHYVIFRITSMSWLNLVWLARKSPQLFSHINADQHGNWQSVFFCFWWSCFYPLCFVLVFCKQGPKKVTSCNFRVFFKFCSPARPVFKILLFFLFRFLSWFSFCLPFQKSIFSLFFVHQPLFRKHYYFWFLLFFRIIDFSFPNVCLFLWDKLSLHPLFKPRLLSSHFWQVLFFLLLFLFSWYMFLFFCFYVGFVFGSFLALFSVLFLVLLSVYE